MFQKKHKKITAATDELLGKKNAGTHGFDIEMMVKSLAFFQILVAILDLSAIQYSHFSPISLQEGWIGYADQLVYKKRPHDIFFNSNK